MLSRGLLSVAAIALAFALPAWAEPGAIGSLRYLGAATIPNGAEVDGTPVGGLSGLDYNPTTGEWVIISDDRSEKAPARFYLANIDLSGGAPKVALERAVTLQQADGKPYPKAAAGGEVPDPESIRFDSSGTAVWWTSEGDRRLGLSPFLREARLDGTYKGSRDVPPIFAMHRDAERGPRNNLAFEGLSFTPSHDALWLGMESALYEDGPLATPTTGTVARFTEFDEDGKLRGQYAYPLDRIQAVPSGKNADNGVSEILAQGEDQLLVLERSGVEGADGKWTLYIRIYQAEVGDATDVSGIAGLAGATYKPMTKRLLLDLSKLPEIGSTDLPWIDNIEGMSFGPDLPNGHRSLVLVSDNNFNPMEITQFLAFEILP